MGMQSIPAEFTILIGLSLSLATGCKTGASALDISDSTMQSEEGPIGAPSSPPPAFVEFCEKYPTHTPGERIFYEGMIIGSSSESEFDLGQQRCSLLWSKLLVRPVVQPRASVDDVSPIKALIGLPNLTLSLVLSKMPRNFRLLAELDLIGVLVHGKSDGTLTISDTDRKDILATIANAPRLEKIELVHLGLRDLSPLTGLKRVKILYISDNDIAKLEFLRDWQNLQKLNARENQIEDLTPLENLLQLTDLSLSKNSVKLIDALMSLANLKSIDLSGNLNLTNLLAIQYLPNLTTLSLADTGIKNIEPLRGLQLTTLDLSNDPVDSIDVLRTVPLTKLSLHNTKVQDIGPIASLTTLKMLDVSSSPVRSLPILPPDHSLWKLTIKDTQITNLCPATQYPMLEHLMLPDGRYLNRNAIEAFGTQCLQ